MIKIRIYNYLEQKEADFLKLISKNHFKILCFLIPSGTLLILSKLPYFNLIIRGSFAYILIVIYSLFIFKVTLKHIITTAFFTLLTSVAFLLLKLYIPAISLFDFTFGMMLVAFIKFISSV